MALPALALSMLLAATPAPTTAAKGADPWAPLRFLVGNWKAEAGGGKPGEAIAGSFGFTIDLDGKVGVRRGRSTHAPRTGETQGTVHEDLMVVYPKGKGLAAIYWDNEGHVIRYGVRTEAGTVILESEAGAPGPRFRLVYARRGADLVEFSFSIAPPGGAFAPPVSGLARRTQDPL